MGYTTNLNWCRISSSNRIIQYCMSIWITYLYTADTRVSGIGIDVTEA